MKNLSPMNAVILAGGEGSRLRPITCKMPKPLAPVVAQPVMAHILKLLSQHGVRDAVVTTHYLSGMIREYFQDEYANIRLRYYEEEHPMGTAGSVKAAENFIDGDFLVISGDAICDFDLSAAIAFHRERRSDATVLVYPCTSPSEYGVVISGSDGKIAGFVEKPAIEQSFSDQVNTGIYIFSKKILEEIPADRPYDFAKDLFPKFLREGKAIYAYQANGYWCDIGNISAFYRCNMDLLEQEGKDRYIDPEAEIEEGAEIGEGCIIGAHCRVQRGAKLNGAILFEHVSVSSGATIDNSIICSRVIVENNARIPRGCVIGEGSVIGPRVSFSNDILVWNDKQIGAATTQSRDLIFGTPRRNILGDHGICGKYGEDFDVSFAAKIGAAAAGASRGRIGIAWDRDDAAEAFASLMGYAALAQGAEVYLISSVPECVAAKCATDLSLDLMLHVSMNETENVTVCLYDGNGLYPARDAERKFETEIMHATAKRCSAAAVQKMHRIECADALYLSQIQTLFVSSGVSLEGMRICVRDNAPSRLFAKIASALRADVKIGRDPERRDYLYIDIDDSGLEFCASQISGDTVYFADRWHMIAMIIAARQELGCEELSLPYTAPEVIERTARDAGFTVLRYVRSPAVQSKAEKQARALASKQSFLRDGVIASLWLCRRISRERKTVRELLMELPDFYVCFDELEARDEDKTYVMRALFESGDSIDYGGEGIRLNFGYGDVHIVPKREGGFSLMADAYDAEAAEEIIGASKEKILRVIEQRQHSSTAEAIK